MFSSFKRRLGNFGNGGGSNSSNNNNASSHYASSISSYSSHNTISQTPSTFPSNPSTETTNTAEATKPRSRYGTSRGLTTIPHEWTQRVPQLAHFDACIAAAEALAATSIPEISGAAELLETEMTTTVPPSLQQEESKDVAVATCTNSSLTRRDPATGLIHTSVLISPDGTLLLVPPDIMTNPEKLPLSKYFDTHLDPTTPKQQRQQPPPPIEEYVSDDDGKEEDKGADKLTTDFPENLEKKDEPKSLKNLQQNAGVSGTGSSTEDRNGSPILADKPLNTIDESESPQSKAYPALADEEEEQESTEAIFSELLWNSKDEYAAAMFYGHDLSLNGDAALNGFSAKGWSLPATTYALRQTHATLEHWADFCHAIILARKESAVKTHLACDTLRSQVPRLGGYNPPGVAAALGSSSGDSSDSWEIIFDPKTEFTPTARRGGPLLGTDQSSMNRALLLMEDFYSQSAEAESTTWRQATVQQSAILPQLQLALEQFHQRMLAREHALEDASQRVRLMEERLQKIKAERDKKWDHVYRAEERVSKRMEALWKERTRQREKARMNQLREHAAAAASVPNSQNQQKHRKQNTQEQVWDMVAAISNDMESTSFEPMNLTPKVADQSNNPTGNSPPSGRPSPPPPPPPEDNNTITREALEEEVRLPELRALAMAADDAIDDCASQLLMCLSNLDTTRRSARVAAETALLAAANAQTATFKSLIQLERQALQQRLQHLDELEQAMPDGDELDVRSDLSAYIAEDKRDRGGLSYQLGDDDDGGIASALATLSSHVNIAETLGSLDMHRSSSHDDDKDHRLDKEVAVHSFLSRAISRERIEEAVNSLFSSDDSSSLEDAITLLCNVAKQTSAVARRRRSTICYCLNSKRSGHVELQSKSQFDGLVRVFEAILTNCSKDEEGGMPNAKMLMMLAQTFYLQQPPDQDEDGKEHNMRFPLAGTAGDATSPGRKGRNSRLYIKSRLTQHRIWSKDDFWDQALSQQITESLTQSGVMGNFEASKRAQRGGDGEYRKSRKTDWHDWTYEERVGAASQVHAVVFAQLGALSHSMVEFGCGLTRACAFVRRMAIRHGLPSSQRNMLLNHLIQSARRLESGAGKGSAYNVPSVPASPGSGEKQQTKVEDGKVENVSQGSVEPNQTTRWLDMDVEEKRESSKVV